MGGPRWPRIAGFRVVASWPEGGYARPPRAISPWAQLAGVFGVLLILAGTGAVGVVFLSQRHAPQPSAGAAGAIASAGHGPSVQRSMPVSVDIPAIGVTSRLLHLGLNSDGTVQVPSLVTSADEAAWYKYSATPGQIGASVIEGHVDSYQGPAVFFRLGALRPGDIIDVTLARRGHGHFPGHRRARVRQIQFPDESHLRGDRLCLATADNVRWRFRLCHRALPQFHCCIRVPDHVPAGMTGMTEEWPFWPEHPYVAQAGL